MANDVVDSTLEKWWDWEDQDVVESASVNLGRLEKGSHEFVINNYSTYDKIGVNQSLESDCFTVGGHQWAILVYPNGRNKNAGGDVSIFIVLKSECNEPVQTLHEFLLIGGENSIWAHSLIQPDETGPIDGYIPSHTQRNSIHGSLRFIDHKTLEDPRYMFLKDNCLRIRCTIVVYMNKIQDLPVELPEHTIYTDFAALFESERGTNVSFNVGNETVRAHKSILGAQSHAFRPLFSDLFQPQVMDIQMEPKIFKAMLWFMYTGALVEEEESHSHALILHSFLAKMLSAARNFGLERLKKICESRITELEAKFPAEVGMASMLSSLEISSSDAHISTSGVNKVGDPKSSSQKPSVGGKFIESIKKLNLGFKGKKTKTNEDKLEDQDK